jgi:hypothetical protein
MEQYRIPTPPDFVYAKEDVQKDPSRDVFKEAEQQPLFTIVGAKYPKEEDGGGIFLYYKELLFPRKGFPYPEAVYAVNFAKRQIVSWLRFFVQKGLFLSYLGFLILTWDSKVKILSRFLRTLYDCVDPTVKPYYLLPRYYMAPARELDKYTRLFLENLGIDGGLAQGMGKLVAMIIEYDTAYCWRIQDIFSVADRDSLLKNPAKEMTRLLKILIERDQMSEKVRDIAGSALKLLRFALRTPKIKRAFIKATQEIDLSKIAFTEADRYQVSFLKGYNFMGKTGEERIEYIKDLHNGVVPTGPFQVKLN